MSERFEKNTIVFIIATLSVVAVDQFVKALVVTFLTPGQSITVIPHVLQFTHVRNSGAAFGLFAGSGQIMLWSALIVVVLTLVWFFRAKQKKDIVTFIALSLIIGGAAGNLVDRIFRGRVVDFIDVGWWPVFNTADIAIVVGVIMLFGAIVFELFHEKDENGSSNAEVKR